MNQELKTKIKEAALEFAKDRPMIAYDGFLAGADFVLGLDWWSRQIGRLKQTIEYTEDNETF